jgi:hypothetical protein
MNDLGGGKGRLFVIIDENKYPDEELFEAGIMPDVELTDGRCVQIAVLGHYPGLQNPLPPKPPRPLTTPSGAVAEPFEYGRYLASREWALKKRDLRERSNAMCERCGRGPYQETHHLTYERIGHERLEDLQALCRRCHQFLSAVTDIDPLDTDAPV